MVNKTPKTGWVHIKVEIPIEWKESLEEIKRRKVYKSTAELLRSILREYLIANNGIKDQTTHKNT